MLMLIFFWVWADILFVFMVMSFQVLELRNNVLHGIL